MPEAFGADGCAFCKQHGEPEWRGRTSINGTVKDAHAHFFARDAHQISGPLPEHEVAGNYDYEEGGIIHQADAEFIARARTLLPELAQQLEQAEQREQAPPFDWFVE